MKRTTIKELSVIAGVSVTLCLIWLHFASAQRARLTPKPGTTFGSFADAMSPPSRLAHVGNEIVWVGDDATLSLPSGPSCYVFDESGILVRWNLSTGDGERTTQDLVRAYGHEQISIEDAKELILAKTNGKHPILTANE